MTALHNIAAGLAILIVIGFLLLQKDRGDVRLTTFEPFNPALQEISVHPPHPSPSEVATSQFVESTDPRSESLSGQVLDAAGQPVPDVIVRFLPLAKAGSVPRTTEQTRSRADGTFHLASYERGNGHLHLERFGYRDAFHEVVAPSSGHLIALERERVLKGRILTHDQLPVSDAVVQWQDFDAIRRGETTTDTEGRFVIENVPHRISATVLAEGHPPTYAFSLHGFRREPFEWIIRLQKSRTIRLQVVDGETRTPIKSALVTHHMYRPDYEAKDRFLGANIPAESAHTDADGRCDLRRIPKQSPGVPETVRSFLWVESKNYGSVWQKLPADPENGEVLITLYPAASVEGRVVDPSGRGVEGVTVWAESDVQLLCLSDHALYRINDRMYSWAFSGKRRMARGAPFHGALEAVTDGEGRYRIDGINATRQGGSATIHVSGMPKGESANIMAFECAQVPDLLWNADQHLITLGGQVVDEHGVGIPHAQITSMFLHCHSDHAGHFEFQDIRSSSDVSLSIFASGFVKAVCTVPPTPRSDLKITLQRGAHVPVLVRGRFGTPLLDALVSAYAASPGTDGDQGRRPSEPLSQATTDAEGRALLVGVPHSWDLTVAYPPGRWSVVHDVRGRSASDGPVVVDLPDIDKDHGFGTLLLDVVDAASQQRIEVPLDVEIQDAHGRRTPLTPLAPFRETDLRWGSLTLRITAPGFATMERHITFDQHEKALTISLGAGCHLRGQLHGLPLPLTKPLKVCVEHEQTDLTWVPVDAQGRYSVRGLPEGPARISVPLEAPVFREIKSGQPFMSRGEQVITLQGLHATADLAVVPCGHMTIRCKSGSAYPNKSDFDGIRFQVHSPTGDPVFDGIPKRIDHRFASLSLNLPVGRYDVRIYRNDVLLAERSLSTGERFEHHLP